jgi:hypothetical protein
MTLDLALITWQPQGMERVAAMHLPRVVGVRYVVSWQNHGDAPIPEAVSSRDDIVVCRTDVVGVSANRNNALNHCTADIVLNADDDVTYYAEGLQAVISTFENAPDLQFACFKIDFGTYIKPYPDRVCDLAPRIPKGMWFGTIEMAVRRNSPAGELRFDERFGPGAPYLGAGEDEYYLLQSRQRGYVTRYYPITIGKHPDLPTASRRITDKKIIRGMGALLAATYAHPRCTSTAAPAARSRCSVLAGFLTTSLLPRIVLRAWRLHRAGQHPLLPSLATLLAGALYHLRQ